MHLLQVAALILMVLPAGQLVLQSPSLFLSNKLYESKITTCISLLELFNILKSPPLSKIILAILGARYLPIANRFLTSLSITGYSFSDGRSLALSFPFFLCPFHFLTNGVKSSIRQIPACKNSLSELPFIPN